MRLSGDLPALNAPHAPLNLVLEIMPKPEFLDSQKLVFLLLAKYSIVAGSVPGAHQGNTAEA